ncbi:MAG: polyhydroxyalkanoic acid system family protein [Marinicella sp.]|nr:polyhydroxyalkanoic acid system family protein [Xanthomonadales bacterium]
MSEICINYPFDCHIDHSKETLKVMLNALEEKYAIQHHFISESECNLSGAGVNGQLTIHNDSIDIYAKLGFFMMPFKSIIEKEILDKLNEHFLN